MTGVDPTLDPTADADADRWWRRAATSVLIVAGLAGLGENLRTTVPEAAVVDLDALGVSLGLIAAQGLLLLTVVWLLFLRSRPGLVGRDEVLVVLAWGAVVATAMAIVADTAAARALVRVLGAAGAYGAPPLTAPPIEETAKALAVLVVVVVTRSGIRSPLQAMALGSISGIGFGVVENVGYALRGALADPQDDLRGALVVTAPRAAYGVLDSHWIFSGWCGLAVGRAVSGGTRPRARRVAATIALGVAALAVHAHGDAQPLLHHLLAGATGRDLLTAQARIGPAVLVVFLLVVRGAHRGHDRYDRPAVG